MKMAVYVTAVIVVLLVVSSLVPASRTVQIGQSEAFVYPAEGRPGFVLVYGQTRYYQAEAAPAGCYNLIEPGLFSDMGTARYLGETCP